MNLTPLTGTGQPRLHLLVATPSDATDALWGLERSNGARLAVRFLRGRKAPAAQAFFDEAAAALQFPYYFGENWDAFHDCLTDLEWFHTEALVLCLMDAASLLETAPADASKFARVIETAVRYWNHPDTAERARAFHVVFQATAAEEAATASRWHGFGLNLSKLR